MRSLAEWTKQSVRWRRSRFNSQGFPSPIFGKVNHTKTQRPWRPSSMGCDSRGSTRTNNPPPERGSGIEDDDAADARYVSFGSAAHFRHLSGEVVSLQTDVAILVAKWVGGTRLL